MEVQTDLFEKSPEPIKVTGETLKDEGMKRVAENNTLWLARMRERFTAFLKTIPEKTVFTSDEWNQWLDNHNIKDEPCSNKAWGCLWRVARDEKRIFWTGNVKKAVHPRSRAGLVREWRKA
jgi:hypothetical protein